MLNSQRSAPPQIILANQYKVFPSSKPEVNQLIWYLGPVGKEILGYYVGKTFFVESDGTNKGYYAKYWRPADEQDYLLPTWSPDPVVDKKIKRNVKSKKKIADQWD